MFDKLFANQKSCIQQLEKSNEQAITSLRAEYQSGYRKFWRIPRRLQRLLHHRLNLRWGSPTWAKVTSFPLGFVMSSPFRRLLILVRPAGPWGLNFVVLVFHCPFFLMRYLTNLRLLTLLVVSEVCPVVLHLRPNFLFIALVPLWSRRLDGHLKGCFTQWCRWARSLCTLLLSTCTRVQFQAVRSTVSIVTFWLGHRYYWKTYMVLRVYVVISIAL